MTSRNRERNSVHDRTHTHLRAIQEGQTHQGSSMGELLNDIKTNTSNINLNVDSLEVNTDTLESKIQATNDKLDTFSGAGNNNIGEGQVKLQIYNYGRDVSAGNYKPMAVDSDGHLQVDSLSSALPTGASTEAKQDVMNTKLDSIETDIEALNTKLDTFSGAGNNNVGEGQTKLQIYNYGRDVSAGNYKPMVVDSDGHLQVDTLSSALPTGASTEAKQDAMNTKLDTISGQLVDDNKSVANGVNAVNTNVITQNTNFHNKVAFLQASVDAESSPPSATTEILLTEDVPMLFKMTTLTNAVNSATTAITTNTSTLNSTLTTIDTDTGNIDTRLSAISSTTSANNTLQAGILNGLSGDNSGGGTFAGQNLETIAGRLIDDNKSVANGVNSINTNTITQNGKIDDTNTKLDTIASRLIDDSNSVAVSNNAINTNTITTNSKLDDVNFNLAANNLVLGGGLPSALNSDQLKVSDSSALTKLGTIDTTLTAIETNVGSNGTLLTSINNRLFDDNKSVANAVNSVNTNTISNLAKLTSIDDLALNRNLKIDLLDSTIQAHLTQNGDGTGNKAGVILDAINTNIITNNSKLDSIITLLTSLDTKLSASNTSGHYGNS